MAQAASNYTDCTSANIRDIEIAALIRVAGMWTNTSYAFSGCASFCWRENIKNAFQTAGYSNSGTRKSFGANLNLVDAELKGGHPVIMDGTTKFPGFNDWHIWVVDGYEEYTTYHKMDPNNPNSSCLGTTYSMYHINWGWRGNDNNWFGFSNFTGQGKKYDTALNVTLGMRP